MTAEQDNKTLQVRYLKILILLVGVLCMIVSGFVLIELRSILIPLVLSIIISFILNPIILFFEKRRIPELISFLLVIAITFFALFLVGHMINRNIQSFMANMTQYEARYKTIIENILAFFDLSGKTISRENFSQEFPRIAAIFDNISVSSIVANTLRSVSALLSDTFLVLLYLLFILIGRNKLIHKFDIAFKAETAKRMKDISQSINEQINNYIITKTIISLLTASLVFLTLWLFGVEFAFIWAFLTFLLNFIPNIGSIIATMFLVAFALIQFDNILTVVWIALILASIQFTIGSILEPKIVGHRVNLSPIIVLFSLIFWGYVWGIIGMLLAVPFAVFIKIIFENVTELRPLAVLMSEHKT